MSESLTDRIAAHYQALSGGQIHVPEWGQTIHWAPVTIHDKSQIMGKSGDDLFLQALWTVIIKATDETGKRLFGLQHRIELSTQADSAIIERISQAIHHGTEDPDLGN